MFTLTFLEAKMPLTKKFTATSKNPYPNAYEFKSHSYQCKSLAEMATLMTKHAALGHCMLKGTLEEPLDWESRAGKTNPHTQTRIVCLDIDHLPSITDIPSFMAKLGLDKVDYVLQYSASYGVNGDFSLRAHVFFELTEAIAPSLLKSWLRQINLTIFLNDLALTKTNNALSWGLDITTCQNDKLIYIAPPDCNPPSINKFSGARICHVHQEGWDTKADFTKLQLMPAEQLKMQEEAQINRLRAVSGLVERKPTQFKLKEYKGEYYAPAPDQATVTSIKEERSFVYLNLNGGDSWGYFHPADNATFIYNFKGEPTYRTSELVPDYWNAIQAQKRAARKAHQGAKTFLAFRDLRTAEYYNGWYDESTDDLVLHTAKNEKQLNDFLVLNGQPIPDAVPIWNIIYDPHAPTIDVSGKTVNMFQPSQYMRMARTSKNTPGPTPTIDRVINSVFGPSMYNQFFNWLAFIFQYMRAPGTAWVGNGVQGTGKGILINNIITPIFGSSNVARKRMEELEDKFNSFFENSLIVFIDEAQISDSGRNKMIMSNLKNYITEPVISIRRMRQSSYEVANHCGMIFGSNMPDPVTIPPDDRRFNVGEYQKFKISIVDADMKNISSELQDFALRLQQHPVDMHAVRTPVVNTAKDDMIQASRTSADTIADAINKGDIATLYDALPTIDASLLDAMTAVRLQPYKQLITDIIVNRRTKLSREELYVLFNYNVGNVPSSPWKFTSYLRHHGVEMTTIRQGEKVMKGITVQWAEDKDWFIEKSNELKS